MTVNQFSIVPKILRQSDLVVTVVRRAITLSPYASELMMKPVPLAIQPTFLLWHERLSHHPANEWMRSQLLEICSEISDEAKQKMQQVSDPSIVLDTVLPNHWVRPSVRDDRYYKAYAAIPQRAYGRSGSLSSKNLRHNSPQALV